LWSLLEPLLGKTSAFSGAALREQVKAAIRPEIRREKEPGVYQALYGIPTGSPLQPMLLNLYLTRLDEAFERACASSPHSIYFRYGDDFLFAHPEEAVFRRMEKELASLLQVLEMEVAPEKTKSFRWSGSGFQGKTIVEFLGYEIHFNGGIRLNQKKHRELVFHVRHLVRKPFYVLRHQSIKARILAARALLSHSFFGRQAQRHPYLDKLLFVANDRNQLKELDHELAYAVSREITGARHARTFREVSKEDVFKKFGFPSLVARRNRGWKN
jgi:hypothetical protein